MVSAQIPGLYRIYVVAPSGASKLIIPAPAYWFAPGGSSEGVVANTPEKWNFLPLSGHRGTGGYKIVITLQGVAATSDASDGAWMIPIFVNGSQQTIGNPAHAAGLGNDNFTVDLTPSDIAFVALNETKVAEFRAKEGVTFQVGGGRVFMSIEDNA